MHFAISWDINSTPTSREQYEKQLVACFSSYPSFKPLSSYYIVQVQSQADYNSIVTTLQNIGTTIPGIRLIVTPLMTGGRYNGLHENQTWNSINQISG